MNWRTDKPTEKVIVAKLTEDFCHQKDSYAILRRANEPYQHYSENGEEIPYAAIEKWALLEEQSSEDLEKAAEEFARTTFTQPFSEYPENKITIVEPDKCAGFLAGAHWQKERMMKDAVEWIDWNNKNGGCLFDGWKKDFTKAMED